MTASFTQTDRRGRLLNGTMSLKRPGKIRFDYGCNANMLIVGDGRALTFIDYDATCSAGRSTIPFAVGAQSGGGPGCVSSAWATTRDDAQVLMIEARPAPARVRHHHHRLRQGAGGAGRPDAAGLERARRAEPSHHHPPLRPALQRAGRGQPVHLSRPAPARPARLTDSRDKVRQTGPLPVHRGDRSRSLDMGLQLRELVRVFPLRCPSCAKQLTLA